MASLRYQLAAAVVARIQAGQYSANYTVENSWRPEKELSDLLTTRVIVVPSAIEYVNFTRSHRQIIYTIDVGVQRVVEGSLTTDVLDTFTDELIDQIAHQRFVLQEPADEEAPVTLRWVRSRLDPIHSIMAFDEYRVYQSVANHDFLTIR